ncbi:MAG: hypothetical protein IPK50_14690 [Fibrobacterota bacterium]|nr:hypothetical protein [Fibrobacterota bacterium]QQS03542.1 MAG: hypothetical protein IPK50_14690 [Fibrobacterota bacterium]
MRSGPKQRFFPQCILGVLLIPLFTSCFGDAPTAEPSVQTTSRKTGTEVTVSDQHHNRIVHDTAAEFDVGDLDSLSDGVYHVVRKRLSDENLEFQTVVVGKDGWMKNGVGTLRSVEIQDFFCVVNNATLPISGYCEQVTGVLRFSTDLQGNPNGAIWSRCGFEVGRTESRHWAKNDTACAASLKSAYQGVNHFEKLFADGSSLRVVADSSGVVIQNDSISIQWRKR